MDILARLDRWKDLQLGDLPAFTKDMDWVAEIKRDIADAREIIAQGQLTPSVFRDLKDSLK